jgi:hypothetical protein
MDKTLQRGKLTIAEKKIALFASKGKETVVIYRDSQPGVAQER